MILIVHISGVSCESNKFCLEFVLRKTKNLALVVSFIRNVIKILMMTSL